MDTRKEYELISKRTEDEVIARHMGDYSIGNHPAAKYFSSDDFSFFREVKCYAVGSLSEDIVGLVGKNPHAPGIIGFRGYVIKNKATGEILSTYSGYKSLLEIVLKFDTDFLHHDSMARISALRKELLS